MNSEIKLIMSIKRKSSINQTPTEKLLIKYYSQLFQIEEVLIEERKQKINAHEALNQIHDVIQSDVDVIEL